VHSENHQWWSPSLGQNMELRIYGHAGKPAIVFPTSCGRFFDFENFGMVEVCRPWIESGRLMLAAVDSVDGQSWQDDELSAAGRNRRHDQYDRYVATEVAPFLLGCCVTTRAFLAMGCSMGAYHAVNFFFRHPDVVDAVIGMSGLYRLDRPEFRLGPNDLPDVYANSPITYLPGLKDRWRIDRYRKAQIVACFGQGDWEGPSIEDGRELQKILEGRSIPAWIDVWGHDVKHDWPWWKKQLAYHLDKLRLG
jgi:esterase/lipase superfamily enzyme